MFRSVFRQRFYLKNVCFFMVLISFFQCQADSGKTISTTETKNEDGSREVVHSYSADTPAGRVDFAIGTRFESHDNLEGPVERHVGISYTPNEPKDNPFDRSEQHDKPQRDDVPDRPNFDDHHDRIKDAAMSRDFDNMNGQDNGQSANHFSSEKKRSALYNWCKDKKESIIGPSLKTIKDRQKLQKSSLNKQLLSNKSSDQDSTLIAGNDKSVDHKEQLREQVKPQNSNAKIKELLQKLRANRPSLENKPSSSSSSKSSLSYAYVSGSSSRPAYNNVNNQRAQLENNRNAPRTEKSEWNDFKNSLQEASARDAARRQQDIEDAQRAYEYNRLKENRLLASSGYVFQPSEKYETQRKESSKELDQAETEYYATSVFSGEYWVTDKMAKINKRIETAKTNKRDAQDAIEEEKRAWRKRSLKEIAKKEEEKEAQEKADAIKAEQAKNERLEKQVKALLAYAYKYQLSDELSGKLQQATIELANAQERSFLEYWFTRKHADEQRWTKALTIIEAEIEQEKEASKRKALGLIAQIEVIKTFNAMKDAIAQNLTEQSKVAKQSGNNTVDKQESKAVEHEESEQEKDLKEIRQAFEDNKDAQVIEKQAYALTSQLLPKVIEIVVDRTGIDVEDKIWNDVAIPAEIDEPKDQKNQSSTDNKVSKERQLLEAQYEWKREHNVSQAHCQEQCMIRSMHDVIALAQNDMTVELAQASLQAWIQAKESKTDEEFEYHKNRSKKLHDCALNKSTQSIQQQAQPVQKSDLKNLLNDYTKILEQHRARSDEDRKQHDATYYDRLEKRAQALQQSQEQMNNNTLTSQNHSISDQARGYLMANNMNYAAFDGTANVTQFQHCLTKEIIGIIESSAAMSAGNDPASKASQFARYNCDLAVSAQQLNQLSKVQQAAAIVDLNHFFALYGKTMLDDDGSADAQAFKAFGQGAVNAAYKWKLFFIALGTEPQQTIGKIIENCKTIGSVLQNIAATAYEFSPAASLDDFYDDANYMVHRSKNHGTDGDQADGQHFARATFRRAENNAKTLENGYEQSLLIAQAVVEKMMKKSAQENMTKISEVVADGFITNKVTFLLGKVCKFVGNKALKSADKIGKHMPTNLLDSPVKFMQASNGEMMAIVETTGENIGIAVGAQRASDFAEKIVANTAKANELSKKLNELTQPNPDDVKAFQKSIEPYLNSKKIIDVERLKSIKDVKQIDDFRKYTNNFTNLEKLKPEEILYLNVCDWLDRQATIINDRLKKTGGIKFVDPATQAEIMIEKFDLFHSLLNEMSTDAVANRVKGGHLMIPELNAALLDTRNIEIFGNGFLDIEIKYAGKVADKYKTNSYFPRGTSVEQAVNMIEDAIVNFKEIKIADDIKNPLLQGFIVTNQQDQKFMILIENQIAQFYPYKPKI